MSSWMPCPVVALVRARREAILRVEQERLVEKSGISNEFLGNSKPILELKSRIEPAAWSRIDSDFRVWVLELKPEWDELLRSLETNGDWEPTTTAPA